MYSYFYIHNTCTDAKATEEMSIHEGIGRKTGDKVQEKQREASLSQKNPNQSKPNQTKTLLSTKSSLDHGMYQRVRDNNASNAPIVRAVTSQNKRK